MSVQDKVKHINNIAKEINDAIGLLKEKYPSAQPIIKDGKVSFIVNVNDLETE